jgi:carboxypeptidase PM20D1
VRPSFDEDAAVARLQSLIAVPTMSRSDESATDWHSFDTFIRLLPTLYPATHAALEREIVAGHSMLYRWKGSEEGDPTVLMAHFDVVGAEADGWRSPPFAAEITGAGNDRVIWGRGTLDDKGALGAIFEAVEALVGTGFTPKRDVYLSFGHDEETSGSGAQAIVSVLKQRRIRPALVLDEGGAIVEGIFPGVTKPIAVIGVSEKGVSQISLTVDQTGGHASTPSRMTATVRLARAITRLNRRPFPSRFSETNLEMIDTLGAHATGPLRTIFSRARVLKPVLAVAFGHLSDETRAMVRTTTAVTQLSGSQSANALPEQAHAVVDTRIAVGSSVAETLKHFRRAIRDPAVRVEAVRATEPSPVSPSSGDGWDALAAAVAATHPDAIVTPYIMLGGSDSRHFTSISNAVYRFTPFEMSLAERGTLHAKNERMHVATWLRGIEFYSILISGR